MLLSIPCKTGKIEVMEEGYLRIQAPFKKTIWQVPSSSITGFSILSSSLITVNVLISSQQGAYQADMVTKQNFQKLQALFQQLPIQPPAPSLPPPVQYYQSLVAGAKDELKTRLTQPQPRPSMPIDAAIEQVKLELEGCRLQLKQVNTVMSNERSRYQQARGNLIFKPSMHAHDKTLKKQQPVKEQLQRKILALEQQLHNLKVLKSQGTTTIPL